MSRRIVLFSGAMLVLLLLILEHCSKEGGTTTGPAAGGFGSIAGRVVNLNNQGISDANIATVPPTANVLTNSEGDYGIDNVPVGNYTVLAGKAGYQSEIVQASVIADVLQEPIFFWSGPLLQRRSD